MFFWVSGFCFEIKAKQQRVIREKSDTYQIFGIPSIEMHISGKISNLVYQPSYKTQKLFIESIEIPLPQEWTVTGKEAMSTS